MQGPIEVVIDNPSMTVPTEVAEYVPKNAEFQLLLAGANGATTPIMAPRLCAGLALVPLHVRHETGAIAHGTL